MSSGYSISGKNDENTIKIGRVAKYNKKEVSEDATTKSSIEKNITAVVLGETKILYSTHPLNNDGFMIRSVTSDPENIILNDGRIKKNKRLL